MATSNSLFIDTSGWVAYVNEGDSQHQEAVSLCQTAVNAGRMLVTTNFVIAELVALLTARLRISRPHLISIIDLLLAMPQLEVVHVTPELNASAWVLLRQRTDKNWSLVDAASFVVMTTSSMTEALTTDHHFTQAGFTRLLTR
jgi:predicted nucleic acid-binding protein